MYEYRYLKEKKGEEVKKTFEQITQFITQYQGIVIIGTANQEGIPHLAMEKGIRLVGEKTIYFETWFCKNTIENLQENPKVVVALWDQNTQKGYQLLGRMKSIEEGPILNGYIPGEEAEQFSFPPQAYQITIDIEKVTQFLCGPHSDKPFINSGKHLSSSSQPETEY